MMKNASILLLTIILVATLIISGLISLSPKREEISNKLIISASFYPLAEFANRAGRHKVKVNNITPTGVEPHDFEPSPKDIVTINQSKVFLFNDAGLDVWATKVAKDLKNSVTTIINMSKYIKLIKLNADASDKKSQVVDPHFWLDPVLAQKEVSVIAKILIKTDRNNSSYYRQNSRTYITKLKALDAEYKNSLSNCQTRDIVSSHAAFGYLAKRYNLNVFSISVSPEQEPSPQQIARITDIVQSKNIKYIFFETLVSPKIAETIAQETGAKTLVFNPIEGLTEQEQKAGKNYITIMRDNLENLKIALQCNDK